VVPGAVVSVYGTGLAPFTQVSSGFPLTTSLAGVTVSVNGINAPLYFASSGRSTSNCRLRSRPARRR